MIRILWQTLGRTTNEIFGVEGSRLREFTIIILEELKYRQVQQNFEKQTVVLCNFVRVLRGLTKIRGK